MSDFREAMHSVFLYYAIKNGMDMAIVNAGKLPIYEDLDAEWRALLAEVILNQSEKADHVDRLIEYAKKEK